MRKIGGVLSVALLSACATANSNRGMMITEDTALLTRIAAANQSRQALIDATMSDAARFTRAHGYRYFTVVGTADATETVTRNVAGQQFQAQAPPPRYFGNTNLSPAYLPGATFDEPDHLVKQTRLGVDVTIRMYRDGAVDPAAAGVWNSDTVLAKAGPAR